MVFKYIICICCCVLHVKLYSQVEKALIFKITATQLKVESLDLENNTLKSVANYSFKYDPYNTYSSTYNITRSEYVLECDTAIIVLSSTGQLLKTFSKVNDIEGMEYDPVKQKIYCCMKFNNAYVFCEMHPETGVITMIKQLSLKILFSSCIDYERGYYYIISDVRGLLKIAINTGKKVDSMSYFATQNCQANEVDLISGKLYTVCNKGTQKLLQCYNPVTKGISTIDTLENYATGFFGFNASAINQTNGDWLIVLGKNIGRKNVRTNAKMDTLTVAFNSVKQLEYPNAACYRSLQFQAIKQKAVTCAESIDGAVIVQLRKHLLPHQLSIDNGPYDTITQFNNLGKGNHLVKVKDGYGFCFEDTQVVVKGPEQLQVVAIVEHNRCYGDSAARIHMRVQGGTSPYRYILNQAAETGDSIFLQLVNGNYSCKVLDINGCKDTVSDVTISSPAALQFDTIIVKHNMCFGESKGLIKISAKGGVAPYTYKFGTASWGNVEMIDSLPAKNQSFMVRDFNNCEISSSAIINEPVPLKVLPEVKNISCKAIDDGQLFLKPMAQQSLLTLRYYINGFHDTLMGLDTFKNLQKGIFILSAFNENGCKDTATIVVRQPLQFEMPFVRDTVLCKGQYYSLQLFHPLANTYYVKSNTGLQFSTDTFTIQDAGSYYVEITSNDGCVWYDTFTVKKIDLSVTHDFLMPTYAFSGDTVYIINMSEPLSKMNQWHFSKPPLAFIPAGPDAKLFFKDTGKITIALKSNYDACTYIKDKPIYIYEHTDSAKVFKNKGMLQSQIVNFDVFSNPHDGVHFSIRFALRDSLGCSIYKIDPTGYITGEIHFPKMKSHVFTAFASDKAEIYYLKLVVGRESKVIKVVAVR